MNGHQLYTRTERRAYVRQMQHELVYDFGYNCLVAAVIVTLVLAAIWGHAAVSAGVTP